MAITGAVGAALRQDAPYQAEIQMGAQLVMDFQGVRSGGRPYYWLRGTRYADLRKVPGWSFSRAGIGYAEDRSGRLVAFNDNEPRITDRGLLVEEARTNVVAYSDDLTVTYWPKTNAAVSLVSDPVMGRVSRVVSATQDAQVYVTQGVDLAGDGQVITRSVYVRPIGGATAFSLRSASTATGTYGALNFLFATETLVLQGTASSGGFSRLADGWYRLWFTMTADATSATKRVAVRLTNGATDPVGAGVDLKFVQAEVGAFPTSPIPTSGAAATRAADIAVLSGQSWLDATPHTVGVNYELLGDTGLTQCPLAVSSGSQTAMREYFIRSSGGSVQSVVSENSVQTTVQSLTRPGARTVRQALRSRAGSYRAATDGVLGAETAKANPTVLSELRFGISSTTGGSPLNGFVQRVAVLGDVDDVQLARLAA